MADEGQPAPISATFPAPPPFYKAFTVDHLNLLQSQLESAGQAPLSTFHPTQPTHGQIPDPSSIPAELQNLLPPPIPSDGTYTTFGVEHAVKTTSTADLTPPPPQAHLTDLLHQILLKFIRITHILAIDPSMEFYVPAWEELKALFESLHAGLNAWRPHQSREMLISMMEEQVKSIKAESERVRESVGRAKEVVEGISKGAMAMQEGQRIGNMPHTGPSDLENRKRTRLDKEKRMWQVIEREVGKV